MVEVLYMSLENEKMGAKVRISDYAYLLEDKYKENKFRELLVYALVDIEDDISREEIAESIKEALEKFKELEEICIIRRDAIMALRAYAAGLSVNLVRAEEYIAEASNKINSYYSREKILEVRDNCMELLVKVRKGPSR